MEDKKDEITIDFGKLIKFFKKKKKNSEMDKEEKKLEALKEEQQEIKGRIKEDKEEIKELKREEAEVGHEIEEEKQKIHYISREKADESISFDFKKAFKSITGFIKKHPVAITLITLLILQFFPNMGFLPWGGIWMRLRTENLPITDEWATSGVYNHYRGQIANSINQQYPNLPDARKNQLIDEELAKVWKEQSEQISRQITEASNFFKSKYQYEHDGRIYTYMPDIDPYAFLRYTRNLMEKGTYEDEKINGKRFDMYTLAPVGTELQLSMHPYTLLVMHKLGLIFNRNVDLLNTAVYFPIIFVILSIILAFFVGRKLAGNVGGFFAATMLAVNSAASARTTWGHADTDAYNLFFPLLIILFFILSVESENKKSYIYSTLTGFFIGAYAFAWSGWWYVLDFILTTMGIYIIYLLIKNRKLLKEGIRGCLLQKEIKKTFIIGILIFISSGVFSVLFTNFMTFSQAFIGPLNFLLIKAATGIGSLWPNVYTTVAELNPASIAGIIASSGGKFIFLIGILGTILLLFEKAEIKKGKIMYSLLLIIWILSTIYASTKGIRFTLLLAPAFAVAFGVTLGIIFRSIRNWANKSLHINKLIAGIILLILFGLLPIGQAKASYHATKNDVPIINDAWWDSLIKIREESEEDAIINSWWDFGHHFKYIANRRVTFDGGTQSTHMAHWIGKVLLTDNEEEAVGILRMLDCGSSRAFEEIDDQVNDTISSINLIYEIFQVDKEGAKRILSEKIDDADKVLPYTHCEPPENYFITSSDMISKAGVWAHFGSWNFERAYIWMVSKPKEKNKAVEDLVERFGYTKDYAERLYFDAKAISSEGEANTWIAPWPGYSSQAGCNEDGGIIKCGNGLELNKHTKTAIINTQGVKGTPDSIAYINEENEFVVIKQKNATMDVAGIIIPRGGGNYLSVFSSPPLAGSMFTRLYFGEGHGLKHFRLFSKQTQITGGDIFVWKIDWKGGEPNMIERVKPKEIVENGVEVRVNYIGYLEDGAVFDSSIQNWKELNVTNGSYFDDFNTTTLDFRVGTGSLIAGFERGVLGMKIGEEKTLTIPPEEAYGTDPTLHPLANRTLKFKVRVEEII